MTGEMVARETTLLEVGQGGFPLVISEAGEKAQYKFVEFFISRIENPNTRRAYARAAYRFLEWCHERGLELERIDPVRTALYFRQLQGELAAPSVKQHLAAIKHLFDFFVTEGVTAFNPAGSVKGPRYSPKHGKTPALTSEETRRLLDSIGLETIKDIRDKAIIATLFYSWVRVNAVCTLTVADYRRQGEGRTLRFKEKRGKIHELPVHHKAVEALNLYLSRTAIDLEDKKQKKLPLFRTIDRYRNLTERPLDQSGVYRLLKARAKAAGIRTDISAHTARATGITSYLENRGKLEQAQDIAAHADPRTTRLYDRRNVKVERSEIERVQY
ncbi:tyrosine-type recombinase/integrase [soil metagenome]